MGKQKWPSGTTVYINKTSNGRIQVVDKWEDYSNSGGGLYVNISDQDYREAVMAIISQTDMGHDAADQIYDVLYRPGR
jgi:hypothetical protein